MSEKIKGKIKAGSAKAVFLEIISNGHMNGKEVWIPKSQIDWEKNYTVEILISDFIAKEKGFISENELNERRGISNNSDSEVQF